MNIAIVAIATGIALTAALCVQKIVPVHDSSHRHTAIDGMRGYLAFFVFLHHSSIWYFYLHEGRWALPPSNLFSHLGQSSVALFFMITGFLFYSKILSSRDKKISWTYIYTSRFMRLVPLYLLAISILLLFVFIKTNWKIETGLSSILIDATKWVLFTIPGAPDINNVKHTSLIMAGVTWSLPYEWLFYFSLPLIALTTGLSRNLTAAAVSLAVVLLIYTVFDPATIHIKTFIDGMLCAALHHMKIMTGLSSSRLYSAFIIILLYVLVTTYQSSHGNIQILILSLVFFGISGGNNLFGVLSWKTSRVLGEMAYSIYLLHGLILFTTFNFIINSETSIELTPYQYWILIFAIAPAVVIISAITFVMIEKPSMDKTQKIANQICNLSSKK
ncbi:acyltransferase family protein [Pseudomonas sp. S9]|uniref:acyltransferase family protein n=1 Tax=Pseudomonas sp. S9 TaxID=686578 RepID=UPI0002556F5C|nr:acyltransferase [Pseudomonas sp. S9]